MDWFERLYLRPLQRYAAQVQQMPAHEEPYTYPGGFLDRSLTIVEGALRLRRSHLFPAGAAPEEQALQAEAWSAALVYAALHGELKALARTDLAKTIQDLDQLVDRSILKWLQDFPELWSQLSLATHSQSSALGALIDQSRQALDGFPATSTGQADACPEPMVATINDDFLPQALASADSTEGHATTDPGRDFLLWLKTSISHQRLSVNQADSKVHVIDGQAFICSPALFQRYCRELKAEHSPKASGLEWRSLQRRFEALQIHRKGPDGMSLWNCGWERLGRPPRRCYGYLLRPEALFDLTPPDSPSLSLSLNKLR